MDIAGVHTLLETAHEAATAVDIERVTLTKATPEQRVQLVYMPGAAHPVPIRVPGSHPSAWQPSECGRAPRRVAVTRMGCCHSDGLHQHPLEPII